MYWLRTLLALILRYYVYSEVIVCLYFVDVVLVKFLKCLFLFVLADFILANKDFHNL